MRANGGTGRRARLKIVFRKKWEFDSLFAHQRFMNLDKFNSLIELFFYKAEKQDSKNILLKWLNPKNKVTFTWEETKLNIFKLSKTLKENIEEGDRCLLVSENRPEWMITDLAIMLSSCISVPAYTTYTERDYE